MANINNTFGTIWQRPWEQQLQTFPQKSIPPLFVEDERPEQRTFTPPVHSSAMYPFPPQTYPSFFSGVDPYGYRPHHSGSFHSCPPTYPPYYPPGTFGNHSSSSSFTSPTTTRPLSHHHWQGARGKRGKTEKRDFSGPSRNPAFMSDHRSSHNDDQNSCYQNHPHHHHHHHHNAYRTDDDNDGSPSSFLLDRNDLSPESMTSENNNQQQQQQSMILQQLMENSNRMTMILDRLEQSNFQTENDLVDKKKKGIFSTPDLIGDLVKRKSSAYMEKQNDEKEGEEEQEKETTRGKTGSYPPDSTKNDNLVTNHLSDWMKKQQQAMITHEILLGVLSLGFLILLIVNAVVLVHIFRKDNQKN